MTGLGRRSRFRILVHHDDEVSGEQQQPRHLPHAFEAGQPPTARWSDACPASGRGLTVDARRDWDSICDGQWLVATINDRSPA